MNRMPFVIPILLLALLLAGCARQAAPEATPQPAPGVTLEPVPAATPEPTAATPTEDAAGVPTLSWDAAAERVRADAGAVYLFAANVGKGDALVLRVGDRVALIDAGCAWARGRVDRALSLMGADALLDAAFLTHTDDDHAGGLGWLAAQDGRSVANWCASAIYTGVKADKHPMVKAVGDGIQWLRRGDAIPVGDTGATLRVLAPAALHEDEDDNSLVMLLESAQGRILLTGDLEMAGEADLLAFGDDLSCDVLKVSNHGDDDTTSAAFASACAAQIAVISTSGEEKPGTPDAGVVRRLEAAGSQVVVTEDSGLGVLVTLKGGAATTCYVDFGAPALTGVSIAEVDASDDRITLQNTGDTAVDLGGCYLHSEKGDELYVFPDGATLDPGATLAVGTNSTKGDYDLLWDDKRVVNKKKTDTIYLYDSWGRVVDWRDNGI